MGTKKQVKGILETLCALGYRELTKKGAFVLPGFANFVVVKKPATKARQPVCTEQCKAFPRTVRVPPR